MSFYQKCADSSKWKDLSQHDCRGLGTKSLHIYILKRGKQKILQNTNLVQYYIYMFVNFVHHVNENKKFERNAQKGKIPMYSKIVVFMITNF